MAQPLKHDDKKGPKTGVTIADLETTPGSPTKKIDRYKSAQTLNMPNAQITTLRKSTGAIDIPVEELPEPISPP
jgi:hypothetical protein